MGYGTIRISDAAHGTLRDLSRAEGKSMLSLLDEAVEILRRQRFLEDLNAAYAGLRADARAWEATLEERRAWDVTLQDGLVVSESRARYATRPEAKRKRRKP